MSNGASFPSNRGGYVPPNEPEAHDTSSPEEVREAVRLQVELSERGEAPTNDEPTRVETTPYSYGPPAAAPRETNYISDENLLVWLAQKQDGLYGELRERMDTSRDRSKLMEDLSHIKERIERNESTPEEVLAEMQALMDSYAAAGSPFETELEELFGPMIHDLETAIAFGPPILRLDEKEANDFAKTIESKVDALGRDDQMELIKIQSLTADINQAAQLASNLMANGNQTVNTIVGNIGR